METDFSTSRVTYQELMSQANASNLLELLHFVHGGQEAPGGGTNHDGVRRGYVHHEGGVRYRDSVDTKLGNGPPADCSYSLAAPNSNLKYQTIITAQLRIVTMMVDGTI